jgi:hypothetical protein
MIGHPKGGTMMDRVFANATMITALIAASAAAADNPFLGTWKLNPAKSKFTGTTTTFEQTPDGEIRMSQGALSYTFKTDGKEYDTPIGRKATWTQSDDRTWTTTTKQDGKVIVMTTRSLSPDGKTMTVVSKGTKPNGQAFEDTTVLQRVSGQSGLIGKWRSKEVKVGSPNTYSFEANGDDGMTLKIIDLNASCAAKFDGKDYPATGPTIPPNLTLALERKGSRSFELTQKQNGKPLFREAFTVSADGKTMTSKGAPVGVNEQTTAVYDRQ